MDQSKIRKAKTTKQQTVDGLLRGLPTMNREALLKLWHNLFESVPSPALHRETLIPILAYRIQEKAFGGLKESTERRLRKLVEENSVGNKHAHAVLRPKTGSRYVREFNGKLHEVTVLDAGYEYEDKTYRSLTEIATTITGSKWSGPAFFGLKRRAKVATA